MSNAAIENLRIGLRYEDTMVVEARHTVPQVGPWPGFLNMPNVYATAMMIGFVEQTCIRALEPYLPTELATVGIEVNVSHIAPTPIGERVTVQVELTDRQKRQLSFHVIVTDDFGPIGEGNHKRAIVERDRFEKSAEERKTNKRQRC